MQIDNGASDGQLVQCGLLCKREIDTEDQYNVIISNVETGNKIYQRKTLGKKTTQKVLFREFFRTMVSKMDETKRLDVVFEDKEKNVSCFLW